MPPLRPAAGPADETADPSRPALKPALRRVWRDASTLQFGLDPATAVVIGGLDAAAARLVESLDGTRERAGVLVAAADLGLDPREADDVLRLLGRAGVLDDGAADRQVLRALDQRDRDRLAPDLAAASTAPGTADGGVGALARRRAATVSVHGAGRVGASVVSLLAAAGIGALAVEDAAIARVADAAPAGLALDDEGARRQDAALRAARRVAPSVHARLRAPERPDLAVLALAGTADSRVADRFLRRGVPHLVAAVREGTGVVGPLVLPGRSSCLRCHDLHRTDRDPAWPRIAAQLSSGGSPSVPCDVVLATAVAATAALQAVAFLDGVVDVAELPTVDGTLEVDRTDGRTRRRTWSRHPLCGCAWPGGRAAGE